MLTAAHLGAQFPIHLSTAAYGPLLTSPPLSVPTTSPTTSSANLSTDMLSLGWAVPLAQPAMKSRIAA